MKVSRRIVGTRKAIRGLKNRPRLGYAAGRINSTLNGRPKQFGWLQAPAIPISLGQRVAWKFPSVRFHARAGNTDLIVFPLNFKT